MSHPCDFNNAITRQAIDLATAYKRNHISGERQTWVLETHTRTWHVQLWGAALLIQFFSSSLHKALIWDSSNTPAGLTKVDGLLLRDMFWFLKFLGPGRDWKGGFLSLPPLLFTPWGWRWCHPWLLLPRPWQQKFQQFPESGSIYPALLVFYGWIWSLLAWDGFEDTSLLFLKCSRCRCLHPEVENICRSRYWNCTSWYVTFTQVIKLFLLTFCLLPVAEVCLALLPLLPLGPPDATCRPQHTSTWHETCVHADLTDHQHCLEVHIVQIDQVHIKQTEFMVMDKQPNLEKKRITQCNFRNWKPNSHSLHTTCPKL